MNEWTLIFPQEKERKVKKRKEKKKKERKEKKKGRNLCFTLPSWLNKAKSFKEKKERWKKEKKKKEERETFVFKTVCWFNIAGTLKRKKEKRKELFLKSHSYLFGRRLLKPCYILNAPSCWSLFVMLFIYRVAFFCTLSFTASYRFHLFSLNVLFALKHYKGILEIWLQWNNFCFNLEVHAFRYPKREETKDLVGYVNVKLETPLRPSRWFWPQINPHIICQLPYAQNGSLD